jgi:hypothetical protein
VSHTVVVVIIIIIIIIINIKLMNTYIRSVFITNSDVTRLNVSCSCDSPVRHGLP